MAHPSDRLTDLDIAHAFVCPHWPYWERFGDPALKRQGDEADAADLFERLWNERDLIERLAPGASWVRETEEGAAADETVRLMASGAAAIANPCLLTADALGRPSLLVRHEGTSIFGAYRYAPLDIRRGTTLSKSERFRLFFYGDLLKSLQGTDAPSLLCVNRDGQAFQAEPDSQLEEYRDFLRTLRRTIGGECPPPVYRKGCEDTSPWGKACLSLARDRDDLALLFSVSQRQMASLRSQGIETVHQVAEMDPNQLDGCAPGLTLRGLLRLQRQARSLIDRSVVVRAPWPHDGDVPLVFFDIESHPGTDQDYLYGLLVRHPDGREESLALDTFDGSTEDALWRTFLAWIRTLPPDYRVYHYGDYDRTRLETLAARHRSTDDVWLAQFIGRMVDAKEIVRDRLVLPLYFYSLKAVAGFLGYRRNETVRHGRDSVRLYEEWLSTNDPSIAETLRRYNDDDVRGLAEVVGWSRAWAGREATYLPPYPWESVSARLG